MLLTQYLELCWTYLYQIFSIGAFLDKDEQLKFWGQNIEVQGHRGVQYDGKCNVWAC